MSNLLLTTILKRRRSIYLFVEFDELLVSYAVCKTCMFTWFWILGLNEPVMKQHKTNILHIFFEKGSIN